MKWIMGALAALLVAGPAVADTITLDNGRKMTVDKSVSVATPQPQITRLVITVHGEDRNYDDYYSRTVEAAQMSGVAASTQVVSPQFRENSSSGFMHWPETDWRHGGNDARYGVSSFAAMDGLVRRFTDATIYPNLQSVTIVGHSAGGQFVQRYALASIQVPRVPIRFVVANPGTYAYLTPVRKVGTAWTNPTGCASYDNWHYGLSTLNSYATATGVAAMMSTYPADSVTYLLGDADTNTSDDSLDDSCGADLQGAHRFERGSRYFEYMGVTFPGHNHAKAVVPGVGHSSTGMYQSSQGRAVIFQTSGALVAKKQAIPVRLRRK